LNTPTFASLGLAAPITNALNQLGYKTPTPIQSRALPLLIQGQDLLGIAQTGTGKTAAFSLPILHSIQVQGLRAAKARPLALILAPTRELAIQIHEDVQRYSAETSIRTTCIFGGANQHPQVRRLAKGVEILVATPGRLMDLEAQGHLALDAVQHFVLDEADRLLDMGFIGDIRKIEASLPSKRQTALFSATMSKEIRSLADFLLHDPQEIKVTPKQVTVEKIAQFQLRIANEHKQAALEQMLKQDDVRKVIVFTRTKHASERITKKLLKAGFSANAINGNKSQNARAKALDRFKRGADWILVATDVAARGIDIQGISHVINFELPQEPENYVHRIGRTARAGSTGVAWSLVDPSEKKQVQAIEKMTHSKIAPLDFEIAHALPIEATPTEFEPTRKFKPDQKKKSATKRKWPPKRKGPGDAKSSNSQTPDAKPRRRPRRKPKKAA